MPTRCSKTNAIALQYGDNAVTPEQAARTAHGDTLGYQQALSESLKGGIMGYVISLVCFVGACACAALVRRLA
ncbi:chromosome segregation ATPase [Eggerthella sp. YY7918]|nr:chromosome segregation ATPase [Eggerthella sp. YY7918]